MPIHYQYMTEGWRMPANNPASEYALRWRHSFVTFTLKNLD
jgi:hypothetical protein